MSLCPFCHKYTASSAWDEVGHMETHHSDIIRMRVGSFQLGEELKYGFGPPPEIGSLADVMDKIIPAQNLPVILTVENARAIADEYVKRLGAWNRERSRAELFDMVVREYLNTGDPDR